MRDVVVIPTYNERDNLAPLVEEVFGVAPRVAVLVVDDSSPDGTAQEARRLQRKFSNLALLVRPEKTGLGNAYVEAFRLLLQDLEVSTVTTMDADFSHSPAYLPVLLRLAKQFDVVIGSRYMAGGGTRGWARWRRFLSWAGNRYARVVSGVPLRDLTAGFVCFRRSVLERMDFSKIHSAGYAYTIESKCFAHLAGARMHETPIVFEERRGGESKLSGHIVREGLLAPWRVRLRRP